jgi:hypothetical protein
LLTASARNALPVLNATKDFVTNAYIALQKRVNSALTATAEEIPNSLSLT